MVYCDHGLLDVGTDSPSPSAVQVTVQTRKAPNPFMHLDNLRCKVFQCAEPHHFILAACKEFIGLFH